MGVVVYWEALVPTSSGTFQIQEECLACRGAAAVFDMSYFGKFYLLGPDAAKAADWLFSADVRRPPGKGLPSPGQPGKPCGHRPGPGHLPPAQHPLPWPGPQPGLLTEGAQHPTGLPE